MKVSEYLNKKYNLLKRGHEYECYCAVCEDYDSAVREAKQLEADAELGRYVKMAFECGFVIKDESFERVEDGIEDFETIDDLIKWGREQEGEVE